jgi:drug/metabolite transporter (DMT)-like permease
MKPAGIIGIILIVIGIVAFAYGGFHFTTEKKVVDLGPLQVNKQEEHNVPFSPILGGLCIVGGIVLLVAGNRQP